MVASLTNGLFILIANQFTGVETMTDLHWDYLAILNSYDSYASTSIQQTHTCAQTTPIASFREKKCFFWANKFKRSNKKIQCELTKGRKGLLK